MRTLVPQSRLSNPRLSSYRSNRFFSRHQTLLAILLVLGVMVGALAVGQSWSVTSAKRKAERASGGEGLRVAAAPTPTSSIIAVGPTLGNYPNSTVALSGEVTVTPDAAPTSAVSINVSTSTNFKGTFSADPTTGVVRVTDAHPAGTYTVTVTAFGGGASTSKTFTLTVQSGTACAGVSFFTNAADSSVGSQPYSVAVGDFNNDGKQDIAVANEGSNTVSIRLGGCNLPPTITAATGLSQQQGSPASNSQIARVTDDGGAGLVTVTVNNSTSATVNGVTVSNIRNIAGTITADIVADCSASNASFTLQASDGTLTATDTLRHHGHDQHRARPDLWQPDCRLQRLAECHADHSHR